MKKSEANFINHCDDPHCDLGTFEYECPVCGRFNIDYETWWEEDNVYKGEEVNCNCEHCGYQLSVKYNKDEYGIEVRG